MISIQYIPVLTVSRDEPHYGKAPLVAVKNT